MDRQELLKRREQWLRQGTEWLEQSAELGKQAQLAMGHVQEIEWLLSQLPDDEPSETPEK